MSSTTHTHYASYLLRMRWSQQDEVWLCQIMLTHIPSGERHYFADLVSLVAYWQQRVGKGGPITAASADKPG